MRTFARYWLAAVSTLGFIVGLVHGLSQGSKLWFVIAWVSIAFAGFMAWYEKRKEGQTRQAEYEMAQVEYADEIHTLTAALAVEYMPLVETIYTKHNRMAAIVVSDDEIFTSVKREHPELNDEALKEAIRGWRARRERTIKPLSLS